MKLGVITKAGKPLEWSSALHLAPKADNDLGIDLGYNGSLLILAQLKKQKFWSAYTSYGSGVS